MVIAKLQPRLVRQKDAPNFFGVSRGFFNKFIRPSLTEIWLGENPQSGIVFDLFQLNEFADRLVERNGRPARKGDISWDVKQNVQVLKLPKDKGVPTGISKVPSTEDELDAVLEQMMQKQRK